MEFSKADEVLFRQRTLGDPIDLDIKVFFNSLSEFGYISYQFDYYLSLLNRHVHGIFSKNSSTKLITTPVSNSVSASVYSILSIFNSYYSN